MIPTHVITCAVVGSLIRVCLTNEEAKEESYKLRNRSHLLLSYDDVDYPCEFLLQEGSTVLATCLHLEHALEMAEAYAQKARSKVDVILDGSPFIVYSFDRSSTL